MSENNIDVKAVTVRALVRADSPEGAREMVERLIAQADHYTAPGLIMADVIDVTDAQIQLHPPAVAPSTVRESDTPTG